MASLGAFSRSQAIVAADELGRYFMAIKSQISPEEVPDRILKRVNKKTNAILGRHGGVNRNPGSILAASLYLSEELFGKNTPYDMAFYFGKKWDSNIILRRFSIMLPPNQRVLGGNAVTLSWIPVSDDQKLLREVRFNGYDGFPLTLMKE